MGYYLRDIDIEGHNAEAVQVWEAYHSGKPIRVPVILGINPRIVLLNPALNPKVVTFERYTQDPDVMVRVQLESQHYIRHNMLSDAEMGLPSDGWTVHVDLQNCYEAAWFGGEIEYRDGQVPDVRPFLTDENKRMLFDRGMPDPFRDGSMGHASRLYEHITVHQNDYSHCGLPVIGVHPSGLGTDGPMTVAAAIRGATEICLEMYEDPEYVHQLLRYITEATIHRIRSLRQTFGHDIKPQCMGFADDSIELLSLEMYREFVLPYHKMLLSELAGSGPHSIHLCGRVDRLMPTLKQELNLNVWDAGFPVNYGGMRAQLGPDMQIQTGPRVSLLLHGTPREVEDECRLILESGIAKGRFLMREANNLSPCTPVENVAAMYEATRKYGKY